MKLKKKLILFNLVMIGIGISTVISVLYFISISNINKVSDSLVETHAKTLNEKLIKAANISKNILEDRKKILLEESQIIANHPDVINSVLYGYNRKTSNFGEFVDVDKKTAYVEYKKASKLSYIKLGAAMQTYVYGSGVPEQQVEIADKEGKVITKTKGLKPEMREEDNSDNIKKVLESATYYEVVDLISNADKTSLTLKAYSKIYKDITTSEKTGVAITSIPLDLNFANKLKDITNTEVVLYNGEKFLSGTFFDVSTNKQMQFGDEEEIYQKFINNQKEKKEIGIELMTKQITVAAIATSEEQNATEGEKILTQEAYRFAYLPIENAEGKI